MSPPFLSSLQVGRCSLFYHLRLGIGAGTVPRIAVTPSRKSASVLMHKKEIKRDTCLPRDHSTGQNLTRLHRFLNKMFPLELLIKKILCMSSICLYFDTQVREMRNIIGVLGETQFRVLIEGSLETAGAETPPDILARDNTSTYESE